jgi:hypothetical protein
LVGIDEGNFDSSLDSDGIDNGSLDLDGTTDGNVEGLLDFDGTEDGIVIAVFDRKTRPPSEPSSILKIETEPPAELLPEGTDHHQNLRNRLSPASSAASTSMAMGSVIPGSIIFLLFTATTFSCVL